VQVKGKLAAGIDPVSERESVLAEAAKAAQEKRRKHTNSVEAVAADFIARHAKPRLRSWREYERMLQDYVLPLWGPRPITEILRSDVTALLDAVEEKRSAALADHVLAVIRKMFNWHAARDERFLSPLVKGMARTSLTARARDRVLTDQEIRALWRAWSRSPTRLALSVKLLLLTAQRRDEVAHMHWAEISGDLWLIPRECYKNGRANAVPLSEPAQRILNSLPHAGEYVFTTTGHTPISGFSKAKAAIDKASGVKGWAAA
jgi:integrase